MNYTERVDGFQITDPTYIGLPPKDTTPTFDIVKWVQTEPHEVAAFEKDKSGKWISRNKISTEYCFVVATLVWDAHETEFRLNSVLLRWLEERPTEAVIQMVLDFAEKKGKEIYESEELR